MRISQGRFPPCYGLLVTWTGLETNLFVFTHTRITQKSNTTDRGELVRPPPVYHRFHRLYSLKSKEEIDLKGQMDLQTENRIAAILMKEAAELRSQADKEGVHAYLREQKVRGRPNSRFLTATVLGVQQANKVVEVNEMWRVRKKEIELNNKLKGRTGDNRSSRDHSDSSSSGHWETSNSSLVCTSNKTETDNGYSSDDGGLRDEELEEFLHKRAKRGRGAVGSRMDEPGPYLPDTGIDCKRKRSTSPDARVKEDWEHRVLGPEKPMSLIRRESSEDKSDRDDWKKSKKVDLVSKKHSKKHTKKDKKDRSKKVKEKKSKHRHRGRHS